MASAHTPDGRFAPGNPGGPGRPARPIERDYLRALADACPPETWKTIVERAVADAASGDAKAREWLASYLLGRPEPGSAPLLAAAVDDALDLDRVEAGARRMQAALVLEELANPFISTQR